jgi:long-subunit acyl-CoA synthetase (AMP-forming)
MYTRSLPSGPVDVTAAAFNDDVRATAKGLMARGIKSGDRVGVLAANSYEWTTLDFALWTVGACAVPIYESSSSEQIDWIVTDAGVCAVAVGSQLWRTGSFRCDRRCPPIWPVDDRLLPAGFEATDRDDDAVPNR